MVVATPSARRATRRSRDVRPVRIVEPVAPPAGDGVDPEAWSRKRIREHVRDGVAVAAFSLVASSSVAGLAFLALRLAG